MRRRIFIGLIVLIVAWIGYRAYRIFTTRSHSPSETIDYSYKDLGISVTYCRPYKKGRMIFGEAKDRAWLPKGKFWTDAFRVLTGLPRTTGALVPNGKYWRLGANDATEVSFTKDIFFADKRVKAGRYRMYAVPNRDSWRITLNSELGKFGYHEPDYARDVVTVDVPVETSPSESEQFTIRFDSDSSGVKMNFKWDKTLVRLPLNIQ
jgi:Protein of unknown function (DUF2911)